MKKNLFLMLGLGAMLLTSCDQDIVNEIYLPGGRDRQHINQAASGIHQSGDAATCRFHTSR